MALASCATFNRNDVAVKVGDRTLSATGVEALATGGGGAAATGDQLRQQMTTWIRVAVLEGSVGAAAPSTPPTASDLDDRYSRIITTMAGDKAKALYESGVNGSPVICLAAITTTTLDDANKVLTQLNNGTPFADAARANSTDTVIAQAGGIVRSGANGDQECVDPTSINNPPLIAALKTAAVGKPFTTELGNFAAVVMLRPFADLLPASQALIATSIVSQDQLDAIVDAASIYVDPRYGRWDPASGAVVTLTS